MTNQEIVSKLWNLCNVLRDDGITYHQYVTELTYILFLKMARETEAEGRFSEGIQLLPGQEFTNSEKQVILDYSWDKLREKSGAGQYFTPRVLIDVMTRLMKPQPGELCNDPACGTFGFIFS